MLKYKEDEIEKAKNRVVQGEEDISLWKMKGDKYRTSSHRKRHGTK